MREKSNTFLLLIIATVYLSCDHATTPKNTISESVKLMEKSSYPFNTPKVSDQQSIVQLRKHMEELIALRQKNGQRDLFDLTYYYLIPYGFANEDSIRPIEASEGYWIKFKEDFTYQYGSFEEVEGSGMYHYTESDFKLLMLDDDEQIEPKFWEVRSNSDYFNFIGQPIIVIMDNKEQERILMSNFSNDGYLATQKIMVEAQNGMQILMKKQETPVH